MRKLLQSSALALAILGTLAVASADARPWRGWYRGYYYPSYSYPAYSSYYVAPDTTYYPSASTYVTTPDTSYYYDPAPTYVAPAYSTYYYSPGYYWPGYGRYGWYGPRGRYYWRR
jgi:hypothetical protein